MKKILIVFVLCVCAVMAYSQVIPSQVLKAKNYQEVKNKNPKKSSSLVDKYAMYPDGLKGINQHIAKNVKYPKQAREDKIEGRVVVNYVVDVDGAVIDIKVVRSVNELLDKEAVRVIKQMDKWEPAYHRGKPVKCIYSQLFNFKL